MLKSIQTVSEWNKVMCRMSVDGRNLANGKDEALVVDEQEQHLIRFLQEGLNRDQDMHDAKKTARGYIWEFEE